MHCGCHMLCGHLHALWAPPRHIRAHLPHRRHSPQHRHPAPHRCPALCSLLRALRGPRVLCAPLTVAPPARGCGLSVGALWAGAPHVARAGSRIRLALTCRCVAMETGEMLMSPWQREPGNFGGDGEPADGVGWGGRWVPHTPRPPPSPRQGRASAVLPAAQGVTGSTVCSSTDKSQPVKSVH